MFNQYEEQVDADFMVWQVRVKINEVKNLRCLISFEKANDANFHSITELQTWAKSNKKKNVMIAMSTVSTCEVTPTLIRDLYKLLKDNITSHYEICCNEEEELTISMRDPLICEK